MQRIVIADNCADFGLVLSGALRSRFLVESCADGKQALACLREEKADVLLIDLVLPEMDGMELLKYVRDEKLAGAVVVTSWLLSDYMMESLSHYGVDYAALKPCSVSSLVDRVVELCAGISGTEGRGSDAHCAVSSILLALGFRTNQKGFHYCRDSILMLAQQVGLQVTKNVYPDVGKCYDSNGQAVEKAIRMAIAAAWERRDNDVWRMYFSAAPNGQISRPTNTQFLTRIADAIAVSKRAEDCR